MKGIILMFAAAVVGAGTLPAQSPGRKHSLSMDVRPISSGGATRSKSNLNIHEGQQYPGYYQTQDQNFSSTRKRGSGVGLAVEVRNLSRFTDQVELEWYFLGKPARGGDLFVFDLGSRPLSVGSASREIVEIESDRLTSTVEKTLNFRSGYDGGFQNNLPSASVKKSGSKVAGWIVRLMADNQVLQVRASSPSLERLGQDGEQLLRLSGKSAQK